MAKATSTAERKRRKKLARKTAPVSGRSAATTARVAVEETTAPRRKADPLDWLHSRKPPRIDASQKSAGRRYGEICAEAARVAMPCKAGTEGAGFGPKTPSRDTFDAIRTKVAVDRAFIQLFPPGRGEVLIELSERVCFHGVSLRDIATHDVAQEQRREGHTGIPPAKITYRALVLEEWLKFALDALRHLVDKQPDDLFHLTQDVAPRHSSTTWA